MEQPQTYLRLLPSKDTFHPKVQRAVDNICRCVIDLVVRHKGDVSIKLVEEHTGLKNISTQWTADILRFMAKEGVIEIRKNRVVGSVAKLTQIIEQEKTKLPKNHGKPWSEDDYVRLAERKISGNDMFTIAKLLKRTESSVQMQCSLLRKAFRLIPIIEKNKVVRDFVSTPKSPNPKV